MATAPENSETIKALFVEALELSPAERPAFLLKTCSDRGVRAEVQRLLSEDDQTRSFLSTPNLGESNRDTESHNRRFRTGEILAGRFKIIRFIASAC
jgi:hypothetical protein